MKTVFIALITAYQWFISPLFSVIFGAKCRYKQSCSEYAKQNIQKYGVFKGGKNAVVRLLSCQPFGRIQQ